MTLRHEARGSGHPVLFIHGSGDFGAFFADTAAALGGGFATIVYDRRGFAGSQGPLASGLEQHAHAATAVSEQPSSATTSPMDRCA